jgi:hypothetical protein
MPASKKTISVAKVLHMANTYMASSKSTRDERVAIDTFISGILHETGNYRGFAVKEKAEVPIYSDAAPYRHFYFPAGKIADEYDAIVSETN